MKIENADKAAEILGQISGKTVETLNVWAEANQRLVRELVDFSTGAAKEGARLYSELQQATIDAAREGHTTAATWQAGWQECSNDPMEWYRKVLVGSVDGTQKLFRMLEGNAQAVTRSAERMQASAEQAGKKIQETVEATVTRLKETYSQN